jgi:hypothetical protein
MKKVLLLNLMLLIISWAINAQTATPPAIGDGSESNPYQIATLENLYWIATNSSRSMGDNYFIQTADIDASSTANWTGGWTPIGNSTNNFWGHYDGMNHVISGLYINSSSNAEIGLFGFTQNAEFKNLGITNVYIEAESAENTGALLGYADFNVIVDNCFSTGTVKGHYFTGGLAGYLTNYNTNTTIRNSYSTCNVSGSQYAGGLVGVCQSYVSILNCFHAEGTVECNEGCGGLIGYVNGATISQCYSTGKVIGNFGAGGLIGINAGSTIYNSYSKCPVTSNSTFQSCGGLVGLTIGNANIINSYSTGSVLSGMGGLVGGFNPDYGTPTITSSFWDTETSGTTLSAAGVGKTTVQMTMESTFTNAGWDFTTTWGMNAGCNDKYPYLIPKVIRLPSVTITCDVNGEICSNMTPNFTATPHNTGVGDIYYSWKLNGESVGLNQNPYTLIDLVPGYEYKVSCEITVADTTCCTSVTATSNEITLYVTDKPDAGEIIGKNLIQVGDTTTLSSTVTGGFWLSAYDTIATVDEYGKVTGTGVGETTIGYAVIGDEPCNEVGWTEFQITVSEPQSQCTGSALAVFAYLDNDNNMNPQNATGEPDDQFAAIGYMEHVQLDLTGGNLTIANPVTIRMRKEPGGDNSFALIFESENGQYWSVPGPFTVTTDDFTEYNINLNENTRYISIENLSPNWLFVESVTFNYPCQECTDGTLTLISDNSQQSVCLSTAVGDIVYTTGGSATGATVEGLPIGVGGTFDNGTFTISGTPIVSGTFDYTVTTTGIVSPCVEATATGTITVNALPDVSDIIPSTTDPIAINVLLSITVSYSDVDGNVETAVIDWGDGSSNDFSIKEHSYANAGVYTITASVDDGCGKVTKTYQYVVVYDPSAGFVTGGGWIESPICDNVDPAYEYMDVSGTANFGFVAKYLKGKQTPDGSTEFQFKAGGLNFKSTDYEWLIIAGSKAQYKGSGTINGSGDFGFMLSAVDADLAEITETDLFRIKIWDKNNGDAVVYDNQCGADDYADLDQTTAIAGGSIVIHSADNKTKSATIQIDFDKLELNVYPNPFSERLYFKFVSPVDTHVRIDLYDLTGRLIQTVFNNQVEAEIKYTTDFIPGNTVTNMYVYRMTMGETVFNGKVFYKQ